MIREKPVTVLVVDDSQIVREQVSMMLREYSEISVIGEASEIGIALHFILTVKPDVVILDISMPEGSGFTLLEYIKTNRLNTKVIMLTNYSETHYRIQSEMYGADYFFDKSNEFEKLPDAILA